jgi:hypothetical protein
VILFLLRADEPTKVGHARKADRWMANELTVRYQLAIRCSFMTVGLTIVGIGLPVANADNASLKLGAMLGALITWMYTWINGVYI